MIKSFADAVTIYRIRAVKVCLLHFPAIYYPNTIATLYQVIIMKHQFIPGGICSKKIEFELDDGKVHDVRFTGGCPGNLKAISKLVDGMDAKDVINTLAGNTCGLKRTSCADQLTVALSQAIAEESNTSGDTKEASGSVPGSRGGL